MTETEEKKIKEIMPLLNQVIRIATGEFSELKLQGDFVKFTLGTETGNIGIKGNSALAFVKDILNHI